VLIPEPLPMAQADSIEERNLDTLVVTPDPEDYAELEEEDSEYRATSTRFFDLLHTKLDVRFNWEEEMVIGKAQLTLTPYFYAADKLQLDAKGFTIGHVTTSDGQELKYDYDGSMLEIDLGSIYQRGELLVVNIEYTARPTTGENGSAAITSDQGLFFINAAGTESNKPQQIWTQGETEFNSRWFPTIDRPNERSTQEISITVEDRFETLSNGLLVSSEDNGDGTRTDEWKMDLPHAPYLFMLAVGEFAVVRDEWQGLEVSYYVEPQYEEDATTIFAHTPEMLSFFSELTGVNFPWQKYAQIVVRDYVSGAMENTTSVVFGEFVQKHKRELIDNHNDAIVAHEMMHHWFGDYVTCESWSNLTLNEGFANYAEYLWLEHKYGRDEAEQHRVEEMQGYLYQASQEVHPLIYFGYDEKEQMFDAHSYNKGGLVLHMLRDLVGEEAFFHSLNNYLENHAFESVEVHDLRLAFEETTGIDLNWFFNQWYLSAGHPEIDFTYNWDEASSSVILDFEQTQTNSKPFLLPTEIEVIYENGKVDRYEIQIEGRKQQLSFELTEEPLAVVLDPDRTALAIINTEYDMAQYRGIYRDDVGLPLRTEALAKLAESGSRENEQVIIDALDDPFWGIRRAALGALDWRKHADIQDKLVALATQDEHSGVRTDAILALATLDDPKYSAVLVQGINDYDAFPIVAASIVALNEQDPDMALSKLSLVEEEPNSDIVAAISTIYGASRDTTKLTYFAKHLSTIEGLPSLDFYNSLEELLAETTAETKMVWMDKFEAVAKMRGVSPYTKIAATRSMVSLLKANERNNLLSSEQSEILKEKIQGIIAFEENPQIISIYQSFMGS